MNWYLDARHFGAAETAFPTTPTYEQRLALIQGIEIWLSDPTGPQNLTEETYDEWCEMMRAGLA